MRILISAGGTGGGVYPALSVAHALGDLSPETEILWVGGKGGMEMELVTRAGLPFEAISAAGVHGVGLWQLPANLLQLARGFFEARRLAGRFHPDALFLTGGYVAVPVAFAAKLRRVPVVLYVPDIEPGLALKTLSRLAEKITVTAGDSRAFFPKRKGVVVTGYPVREELARATVAGRPAGEQGSKGAGVTVAGRPAGEQGSKGAGTAVAGRSLQPNRKTLLAFGGSRGARSINRAIIAVLPDLLTDLQIVHISGELDWPEVQAARVALPDEWKAHYHAFPYLHNREMGEALASADLVVSRAGASVLGEYPLFGLPAILVPYPFAWRYQKMNADYLAKRGAALRLNDEDLGRDLVRRVRELLSDSLGLDRMRAAARALAVPDAARRIARELLMAASPGNQGVRSW